MSLTADVAGGKTGYRSSARLRTRTVFLAEAKMFATARLSYAVAGINRDGRHREPISLLRSFRLAPIMTSGVLGVYAGIRRIPTSGVFFDCVYSPQ